MEVRKDVNKSIIAADTVHISNARLALSVGGRATQDGSRLDSRLDSRRAGQIRSSMLSGAYNSVEMADQVARAVIRSGDL